MRNNLCISASAVWMSRPAAVDIQIHLVFYYTQHNVQQSVMFIASQTAYIHLYETCCTAVAYFLRLLTEMDDSKPVYPHLFSMNEPLK